MEEDFVVLEALLAHDGGTNLTKAYTVAPAFAMKAETIGRLFDVEGGTVKMALAEGTADFEFLTNGEGLLCTHDFQFPNATALATLQRDEVGDTAEVILEFFVDEFGNLIHRVFYCPAIEIVGFLVVIVEHLRENGLIVGVTIGVGNTDEIGFGGVLPAILELLGDASTAFREARVADVVAIAENLPTGGLQRLLHIFACLLGDALIALAMVIGTDIENSMVLAVVPADEFIVLLDEREEAVLMLTGLFTATHLCQEPRTADDSI